MGKHDDRHENAYRPYLNPKYEVLVDNGQVHPAYFQPEPRNGLGTAAVILGPISILLGTVPITGWLGIITGITGLVLGLAGYRRARRGRADNRHVAAVGVCFSILGIILAMFATVQFFQAVEELGTNLDKVNSEFQQPHYKTNA